MEPLERHSIRGAVVMGYNHLPKSHRVGKPTYRSIRLKLLNGQTVTLHSRARDRNALILEPDTSW